MEDKLDYLPDEMREAQKKLNAAMRRVYRAKNQCRLWKAELNLSEQDRIAVESWYGNVSMRWNPDSNTMDPAVDPLLEDCP